MKFLFALLTIILLLIDQNCSAQYPYSGPYSGGAAMQNIDAALQNMLMNNYSSTQQQGSAYGSAAIIQSQGSYLLNESQANINNQAAYSMELDNRSKKIRTYFEGRQMNRYYRDIEEWQRKERAKLKYSGKYNKEAIENIYNVYKP